MTRAILHVDMDAFYASVEVRKNPALQGKPVLVGGLGPRAVVASASYEARRFGVRSAMPMSQARRQCPEAVVVPPDFTAYAAESARIRAVFDAVTPLVEPLSLDEAFLDVTGALQLFGVPRAIATQIKEGIAAATGLVASAGIATCKLLAKLASRAAKPDGVLEVAPGEELAFLHPLPVRALWGVGEATHAGFERLGIRTIGDLAETPVATLEHVLGVTLGRQLHDLAWARDDRAVEPGGVAKSVGAEETYDADLTDDAQVERQFGLLAARVAQRLRHAGYVARTITIKVRYGDFTTVTRSATLEHPTVSAREIAAVARRMYGRLATGRTRIRLLGISGTSLDAAGAEQLDLLGGHQHTELERAADRVRERYGDRALGSAARLTERGGRGTP